MFSKSKKQKSDKTTQPPKLRGMPALKHMRSTKREEYLLKKTKNGMPSISDLEQQNERQQMHTKGQFDDERNVQIKVDVVPVSSCKPRLSSNSSAPVQPQYIERNSDSFGADVIIYDGATPPITKKVDCHESGHRSPALDTNWRFSKGDSGYKSQGDSSNGQDKKKTKKSKRKNEARSRATSGLHDIKQQRKASRESVSRSMRALTPKERESIRFLENVIKTVNENDSADEVFNSDSDDNDNYEIAPNRSCMKINEDTDEAIDYGYASVNDVSRRFSIESIESVGSIIDLVGNLSTSASSSTSPPYTSVDKHQQHQIAELEDMPTQEETNQNDRNHDNDKILRLDDTYSRDARKHYEDVLSHFDEVINSFCIPTDDEDIYEGLDEDTITATEKEAISYKVEIVSTKKNPVEERSRETTSGNDAKERKRKEKKCREPDKEKERKERKKKRKEEKRAMKREQEQREHNEAKLREENIARHVDTITALTQDMIKTAQKEPIYAKIDKTKKRKKDVNQNIDSIERNDVIDPPSPFANDYTVHSKDSNHCCESRNQEIATPPHVKFNSSSTPLASPEFTKETNFPETPEESCSRSNDNEHISSTTNSMDYTNSVTPLKKNGYTTVDDTPVLKVSPKLLRESTENLKHSTPSVTSGKSVIIKPKRSAKSDKINIPGDQLTEQSMNNNNAETIQSSHNNFSRRLSPTQNSRAPRPLSLNLEKIEKSTPADKPYSSFRVDKDDGTNRSNINSKPFVITAIKKPLQLC